jgi:hypothetical protein
MTIQTSLQVGSASGTHIVSATSTATLPFVGELDAQFAAFYLVPIQLLDCHIGHANILEITERVTTVSPTVVILEHSAKQTKEIQKMLSQLIYQHLCQSSQPINKLS